MGQYIEQKPATYPVEEKKVNWDKWGGYFASACAWLMWPVAAGLLIALPTISIDSKVDITDIRQLAAYVPMTLMLICALCGVTCSAMGLLCDK